MFKFHKGTSKGFNPYSLSSNRKNIMSSQLIRSEQNLMHSQLMHLLNDTKIFRAKQYNKKDELNRLSEIRDQRYLARKAATIGNLENLRNKKIQSTITSPSVQNSTLPKPRNYNELKQKETITVSDQAGIVAILNQINQDEIDESKKNDPIAQKEKLIVSDQQGMLNILNNISNNSNNIEEKNIDISLEHKELEQNNTISSSENNQNIDTDQQINNYNYVISTEELIQKLQTIIEGIQLNIYMDPRYNFAKLIQFVYTMYEKYGNNQMVEMIIIKGLIQFNKKQMFKLPEDKLSDIILYIIEQVKK